MCLKMKINKCKTNNNYCQNHNHNKYLNKMQYQK